MFSVAVLSGAGISAESGLKTFRDSGGLWEGYHVEEVATPEAWQKNPALVLEFYNERRKQAAVAKPNAAHIALTDWENRADVTIITQNVDHLHEMAGSKKVIHLHGELQKARSTIDPSIVVEIQGTSLKLGDTCAKGSQLRPHIVWFGEAVPLIEKAAKIISKCDALLVVGTSLVVYPAAGLVQYLPHHAPIAVVDLAVPKIHSSHNIQYFEMTASKGVPLAIKWLMDILDSKII